MSGSNRWVSRFRNAIGECIVHDCSCGRRQLQRITSVSININPAGLSRSRSNSHMYGHMDRGWPSEIHGGFDSGCFWATISSRRLSLGGLSGTPPIAPATIAHLQPQRATATEDHALHQRLGEAVALSEPIHHHRNRADNCSFLGMRASNCTGNSRSATGKA
jgi:hypothetical protein